MNRSWKHPGRKKLYCLWKVKMSNMKKHLEIVLFKIRNVTVSMQKTITG